MDSDVNEFSVAWHNRLAYDRPGSSLKLNISDDETTKLKELCDSRENKEIMEYFKSEENALKTNAADLFHFAVLQLTCNDDPESLKEVLEFGQKWPELKVQWKEEKDVLSTEDPCLSRNPIMIASQQGFHGCASLLHKRGYRIPQVKRPPPQKLNEKEKTNPRDPEKFPLVEHEKPEKEEPGEEERYRQKMLMENDEWDDQVGKFLAIQAFAKPHYLSLGFIQDDRIEQENLEDDDNIDVIKDLEKLDPLRRAFKLSEYAENSPTEHGETANLESSYLRVKEELEAFSRGVLTTCHNMAEVEVILEHTPEKTKKEKEKQPNFKKALSEGRTDFVSHPYFQEYFNNRMMGKTGESRRNKRKDKKMKQENAGKTGENKKKRVWECRPHQLMFLPYSVLLFCFYPLVVLADLFRDADILFEKEKTGENRIFAFFRTKIHTPFFRQNVHVAIQGFFLLLIVLMMWNPIDEATDDDDKEEHRFFSYMVLMTTAILFLEEAINFHMTQGEKGKGYFFESFWDLFSLGSRFVLLVGLATFLIADKFFYPKYENRALLAGDHVLNVSFTLVSLGVAAEFFKVLRFLLLFQTFGPLVICVINCVQDAAKTVAIYVVIFCTFAIFAWGMFKPFHRAFSSDLVLSYDDTTGYFNGTTTQVHDHTVFIDGEKVNLTLKNHTGHSHMGHKHDEHNDTAKHNHTGHNVALEKLYDFKSADAALSRDGLFHRLLWKMYSAGDQTGMQIKYKNGKASHRFAHSVILMGWALYQVIVAIIMINLLIAVMNNTFASVWQTADKKWKYSRSYYQAQFLLEKSTFPPPFQWMYYIAKLVHFCKKESKKDQDEEPVDRLTKLKKLKYLRLLKKLITVKQNREEEMTKEDSLTDLRKDLKQDMTKEIQDVKLDIQKILEKIDQLAKQIDK